MENLKYPWQQAYFAALMEIHPENLAARLESADDAAFERLLKIEGAPEADPERLALEDTIGYLRLLRCHSYHFPI